MKLKSIIPALIVLLAMVPAAFAAGAKADSAKEKPRSYPLDTCIVTENDLDSMGGAVTKVYDGQEVKFCCRACIRKFEKNPAKYLARMEEAAAAAASEAKPDAKAGGKKP
ncbi:MAG TPA: hypothetical protein VHN79_05200 [Lacunisphaera sp.]|nr:hypothetical protein [Lacunisphaera sp.]